MPDVSVTLTLKVESSSPPRTEVTTFKPATNLDAAEVLSLLEETAKRLQGQDQLPLDAGDSDPAYVSSSRPADEDGPDLDPAA